MSTKGSSTAGQLPGPNFNVVINKHKYKNSLLETWQINNNPNLVFYHIQKHLNVFQNWIKKGVEI